MAFHFAHIHDYNRFIAIDIGSYRVRAGIFEIDSGEILPLSSSSIRQNRKNIVDGSIVDMRGMADTIERACTQAAQRLEEVPDDIIVSFSSSAFICDSMTTQYIRSDANSTMTMQEIDTMIKKIESESFTRARKKCRQQFGIAHDDIRLVSSTITTITVDGKSISNPIGFPGKNICLTVLNVFVPASEFNIIRSVIASLGKQIISLLPTPLIFPKLLETTEYVLEDAYIIDVGHTHTTILLTEKNKILSFETFPIGTEMLVSMITEAHPELSLIEIENILCGSTSDISIQKEIQLFFSYLIDVLSGFLGELSLSIKQNNLFCYGGVFENKKFFEIFSKEFEEIHGRAIRKRRFMDIIDSKVNNDRILTYGLALVAHELMLVKKDPLVRILRYVIYNYE